ncbi:DNA polymerase III subunit delta [Nocardioides pantholopis]|uniref:DNA polymerase III subunit delta n=1 Tax=Nocardioides pantholopis TaxID=2483798 RepID=UPI000F078151|nr:DNA polymerase III subunit delta [Nocardioides pantholopis]
MARGPKAADVLGRVTLVTGKEEFLAERTVQTVRAAVRAHDPEAELADSPAADLTLATLGELAAPSLFSTIRCVVVRNLENLPEESAEGLLRYAAAPAEDVALVLVHGGGPKGSGVLTKLRKLGPVTEVKSAELKASEYPSFVAAEVRSHGSTIDSEAAGALVQAVGQDLRSLAAAASQLVNDFAGGPLNVEKVRQYFGGHAEVKNFQISDAILSGDRARALEELRWTIANGTSPVYVLATVAGQLRSVANYAGGNRESGMPSWRQDSLRKQARGWSHAGLAKAIRAVARADADLKGAASDPAYTMERLILTVTGLRERR